LSVLSERGFIVTKSSRENMNILTKLKKSDGESAGSTLTVEHLTKAIKNSIDKAGMPEEEARSMAQHVMNFFGYSERIIDNVLEPEDRDAFYMLEDAGILMTEREETTLYDGREWRIHYWMFRKERIHELIHGRAKAEGLLGNSENVYDEVPDDIWNRE
jgi:Fic family protein